MRTDRAVRRPSSEPVAVRPIVDRQTPVKTLPSLAVGKYFLIDHCHKKQNQNFPISSTKSLLPEFPSVYYRSLGQKGSDKSLRFLEHLNWQKRNSLVFFILVFC